MQKFGLKQKIRLILNKMEEKDKQISEPYFQEYDVSCTKCGLQLDKVCGYVCSDPECPCGLGSVRS